MKKETESFNESYSILKEISDKLRNQSEPNIDELIPLLQKATTAYSVCKNRLESVKLALKDHLANDGNTKELLENDKELPSPSDQDLNEDISF